MSNKKQIKPPGYIKNNQLEGIANKTLSDNGLGGDLPVDIELLCDLLGVKTLIVPNLYKDFSVDAYITDDCSVIVVDEHSFFKQEERARFTIAHELSHCILHKDFLEQFGINNLEDFLVYQEAVDPAWRKTIEIQAYILAGYLLMPTKVLKEEVTKIVGKIDSQTININQLAQVIEVLQPLFKVSSLALAKQLARVFPEFDDVIKPLREPAF